jgi:hypothetical protein
MSYIGWGIAWFDSPKDQVIPTRTEDKRRGYESPFTIDRGRKHLAAVKQHSDLARAVKGIGIERKTSGCGHRRVHVHQPFLCQPAVGWVPRAALYIVPSAAERHQGPGIRRKRLVRRHCIGDDLLILIDLCSQHIAKVLSLHLDLLRRASIQQVHVTRRILVQDQILEPQFGKPRHTLFSTALAQDVRLALVLGSDQVMDHLGGRPAFLNDPPAFAPRNGTSVSGLVV